MTRSVRFAVWILSAAMSGVPLVMRAQVAPTDRASAPATANGGLANWTWDHCLGGLTYGQPLKLALSYGGGLVHESGTGGADLCAFGAAKVGLGGARASLGIGRSHGPLGSGVALSGGYMRTFSSAWGATPSSNYLGVSVTVWPLLGLGGEIGYYARIGSAKGAGTHQQRVLTWSVGFGF